MSDESGNFIPKSFRRNLSHFFGDFLVVLEIASELGIVILDNLTSRSLDSFGSDITLISNTIIELNDIPCWWFLS